MNYSRDPPPSAAPPPHGFHRGVSTGGFAPQPALFPNLAASPVSVTSHSDPDRFTSEDRLMLKLIFYQQQSMQAQLNSVLSWAEQTNARLAALEALEIGTRGRSAYTERGGSDAGPVRPSSPSRAPRAAPSQESRWAADQSSMPHNISTTSNTTALEQRSCTPPGVSSPVRPSGGGGPANAPQRRQPPASSALADQSVESVTGPWDPRNREPEAFPASRNATGVDSSYRSSHVSHLGGFGENPLLHSRHSSLTGAPGQAARQGSTLSQAGGLESSRLSQPHSRVLSAQNTSLHSGEEKAAGQGRVIHEDPSHAPWRSTTGGTAGRGHHTAPVMSAPAGSTRGAAEAPIIIAEREVPAYRRVPTYTAPTATHSRRDAREASTVASTTHQESPRREVRQVPDRATDAVSPPPPASRETAAPGGRRRTDVASAAPLTRTRRDDSDLDSLSDGYGSYESRQYIQSIGLL